MSVDLAVPLGSGDHVLGSDDAPITVVEYGDYECPYCGEAFEVTSELRDSFGGSLRYAFRNLPLIEVHPHAELAAEAAEAVGLQGHFWEMHELLFEHQRQLGEQALLAYAEQAGADAGEVATLLGQGATRERVQHDRQGALRSGANGTPTFFVNGEHYEGPWALEPFRRYLESVLDGH